MYVYVCICMISEVEPFISLTLRAAWTRYFPRKDEWGRFWMRVFLGRYWDR